MKYTGVFLLFCLSVKAQINSGSRIAALGNAGVAMQDAWSLQSNQAGISSLKSPVAAIAYQKQFVGQEINTQSAVAVYPFKSDAFGLNVQRYGFSEYNEQQVGLTYAKAFGDVLFASLTFNYHQLRITNYGAAQTFSVDAGMQYKISNALLLGVHIQNPSHNEYNHSLAAELPIILSFGASYLFSDKVLVSGEIDKDFKSSTDVKAGLEYKLINWFALRGGVSINPFKQYAGFGMNYKKLNFDVAASAHPVLGYSPQLSIGYEF